METIYKTRKKKNYTKPVFHDSVLSLRCHTFGSDETDKFRHQFPEVVVDDRMPVTFEIMIEIVSDAEVSQYMKAFQIKGFISRAIQFMIMCEFLSDAMKSELKGSEPRSCLTLL